MLPRRPLLGVCLLLLLLGAAARVRSQTWQLVDDATIRVRVHEYVDEHRLAPGVVVGVWERDAAPGRQIRFFAHGESGNDETPLGPDTLFELGSITKGFTGLLLAEWSQRNALPLDTSLGELLASHHSALPDELASITLEQLATHRSGLPRISLQPWELITAVLGRDPYTGSTPAGVFHAAAHTSGRGEPGDFSYSNLGYALLGQSLAAAAAQPYEELLRARVLRPHGLTDAFLSPEAAPPARFATGFGANFRPTPHWHLDAYAPAGGLLSSAAAMIGFLEHIASSPPPAWQLATAPRHAVDDSGQRHIGLGWMRRRGTNGALIWHNGGTGGFRTFAGVVPEAGLAIVVLTNGAGNADALALSLLDPDRPPPAAQARPWMGYLLASFGVLLAPGMAWAAGAARPDRRRSKRSPDRLDLVTTFCGAAFLLAISERMGAWQWLPFALWWAGLAATLAAATFGVRAWRSRSWFAGAGWTRALRIAQAVLFAALALLLSA